MQRYERRIDRNQVHVVSLEDLIGEDNTVRVIGAFVSILDIIN